MSEKKKNDMVPDNWNLNPPKFPDRMLSAGGLIPDGPTGIEGHACWYYARCAIQSMKAVDEGAVYEGERDHTESLNNIAWSVARLYGLKDPGEFLKFLDYVHTEALVLGYQWDSRIDDPSKSGFRSVSN